MPPAASSSSSRVTAGQRVGWFFAFAGGLGAAGFLAGFIAPIIHAPSSPQGPLVAFFISGPLGAVLGALLGIVAPFLTSRPKALCTTLVIAAVLYAGAWWLFIALNPPG